MDRRILKTFIFVFLIASSQTYAASRAQYEALLDNSVDSKGPGSAVIVTQGDETLFIGARGMANIELNTPLNEKNVFRLGSITKQFTAAAIMMLQEQKKLSIKDNIHKYVKDFPTEGHTVTIEHLLAHSSGIANYTDSQETMTKRIQESVGLDEMLALFAKDKMYFSPGEQMRYSNTGYVLLGKIIEVASGQDYASFIEKNIFNKLGMKNSYYGGRKIIKNRALGYTIENGAVANASFIDMSWPHAAGSLLSTVEDLNSWFRALKDGRIMSKESYAKMIKPFTFNNGTTSDYGYGLGVYKINKYDAVGHGGGIPGFGTNAFYLPQKDIFIAVFNNTDRANPRDLAMRLAALALEIELPEFKEVKVDENKLKSMMGTYRLQSGSVRTLTLEEGVVYSQRDQGRKWKITPMSDNSFYFDGSLSYFVIEENESGSQIMNFYSNLADKPEPAVKQ